MRLEGRRALVTGAARGIGHIYALQLAKAGADVAVTDLNLHGYRDWEGEAKLMTADSVVEEIQELGRQSLGFELDGTDETAMAGAVQQITAAWGGIDILVNNAGGGVYGDGNDTVPSTAAIADLSANLNRNLVTAVIGSQQVLPNMRERGSGVIINVATQAAILPMDPMYAFYGAAKAAVITYSLYLAEEVGPDGIRVNVIAPGYIETGRLKPIFDESGRDAVLKDVALRRLGQPEDCAMAVEFLASDDSAYISGQVLNIAGGPHVYGAARYR